MSLPRHREYKHADTDLHSEVPSHWVIGPVRAVVEQINVKNEGGEREDYLSVVANVGVMPYAEKGDVGNKKPEDLSKCKMVEVGDLVINSMNYGIGSFGLSSYAGVCSPVYVVLRPREGRVHPRFALRIFEDRGFQKYAQSYGNGILAHRAAIGWDSLKGLPLALPPVSEQEQISAFLDRETAKIDALIEEQQRLIALLDEKRQAVISQAVTKGLDLDAPMQDSGIEWLGEVPAHWFVLPLKWIASFNDEVLNEDTSIDFEIEYVEISGVSQRSGIHQTELVAFGDAPSRARRIVKHGDILVSTVRTYLRAVAAVVDPPPNMIASTGFCVVRPKRVEPSFLRYAVQSESFIAKVIARSVGVSYPAINASDLMAIAIAIPPDSEQKAIAEHLKRVSGEADALIAEVRSAISLLQERRAALISAAVTGKIDVRDTSQGQAEAA